VQESTLQGEKIISTRQRQEVEAYLLGPTIVQNCSPFSIYPPTAILKPNTMDTCNLSRIVQFIAQGAAVDHSFTDAWMEIEKD
jgi:hypothetical protein